MGRFLHNLLGGESLKFDLHVHTNHSDGRLNPAEMVDLAVEKGLSGIAITDHDTTTGINEAIERSHKYDDFKVIPGIEFSCIYQDEDVHILGYFIEYKSTSIKETTKTLKINRVHRSEKIINKLNDLGLEISLEDVRVFADEDFIGRPHIARALINKGYVYSIQEAFAKYLNRGQPAYVQRHSLSIEDSINLIKSNKGISVLAHPGLLKNKEIINHCISLGIDGIECVHSKHSQGDTKLFYSIVKENNLIGTGGSDCHGDSTNKPLLLGKYFIDISSVPKLKEMI